MRNFVHGQGTNNMLGAIALTIALGGAGSAAYGGERTELAYALWACAVLSAVFAAAVGVSLFFQPHSEDGNSAQTTTKQNSKQSGRGNQSNQQNARDNARQVVLPGGTYYEAPSSPISQVSQAPQFPRFVSNKDETLGIEYQGVWWQLRNWTKYRAASDWWMVMEARCLAHRQHLLIRTAGDGWVPPATQPNSEGWNSYAASFLLKCAGDPEEHPILLNDEWRNVSATARTKFDRAAELSKWPIPGDSS